MALLHPWGNTSIPQHHPQTWLEPEQLPAYLKEEINLFSSSSAGCGLEDAVEHPADPRCRAVSVQPGAAASRGHSAGAGPRCAAEHLPSALCARGFFPFPFPRARSGKRCVTPALERWRLEMNPECHLLPPPSFPACGADEWEITHPCEERGEQRRTGKGRSWEANIN